jgi:hypothetical protein
MDALSVAIGFCGGAVTSYLIQRVVAGAKMNKDKKAVFTYMQSQIPQHHDWLSTKNIASNTNLTCSRIEDVCSSHMGIKLSTGQKEGMWSLR